MRGCAIYCATCLRMCQGTESKQNSLLGRYPIHMPVGFPISCAVGGSSVFHNIQSNILLYPVALANELL